MKTVFDWTASSKFRRTLALLVFLFLMTHMGQYSLATSSTLEETPQWSDPVTMSPPNLASSWNDLVADPAGHLYVFWSSGLQVAGTNTPNEDMVDIYYTRWDGSTWSQPIDIVHSSAGPVMPRAIADRHGVVHLFWTSDCLKYSWSLPSEADSAWTWSEHARCLGERPLTPFAVRSDSEDNLYVLFPTESGLLQLIESRDGGKTWEDVYTVAEATGAAVYTANPDLAIDDQNHLHAVWGLVPQEGYPFLGLYYARSEDGGVSWSPPMQIATERQVEPGIVTVRQNVHVVWNGDASLGARYHRWSWDGGLTWSPVEEIPGLPAAGKLGAPGITADSAGTIHMILPTDHWSIYAVWDDGSWQTAEIHDKEAASQLERGQIRNSETSYPRLITTNGNQLHAVWIAGQMLRYTSLQTLAPYVPPQVPEPVEPLPRPTLRPTSAPTATPQPTPTRILAGTDTVPAERGSEDSRFSALAGILPVALLAIGLVAVRMFRLNRAL